MQIWETFIIVKYKSETGAKVERLYTYRWKKHQYYGPISFLEKIIYEQTIHWAAVYLRVRF